MFQLSIKICIVFVAIVFSTISVAEELTQEKKMVIDEMLEITGAMKIGEMMGTSAANQMISLLSQQDKDVDPKFAEIVKDEVGKIMHDEFIANGFINDVSYTNIGCCESWIDFNK